MSTKVSTDLIDLSSNTGGLVWAKGTTAQQPASATAGEMRVDTTTNTTLVYNGTQWKTLKETAFVVPPVSTQFLVVGGGGGAGFSFENGATSGAGGAGGLTASSLGISLATAYTITVGEGGVGSTAANARGISGGITQLDTNTVAGGGGGGSSQDFSGQQNGGSGGSGGGGAGNSGTTTGGSGTAGQGNSGGNGEDSAANDNSGGGGGAGGAGGTATSAAPGIGGSGSSSSITGSSITYAGGGGGADGNGNSGGTASGGGGSGANVGTGAGNSGTFNTGGGAGGSSNGNGAAGGSGVVILRYPTADLPYFTTTGTLNTPSATDTVADTAYPVTNLAYYKLDSNANDSGLGSGYIGQGAIFNGSSSKIVTSSKILDNKTNLTISLWIKDLGNANYSGIIGEGGDSGQAGYVLAAYPDNTTLEFWRSNGDNASYVFVGGSYNFGLGNYWTHIAITVTPSEVKYYKNGVNVKTTSITNTSTVSSANNTTLMYNAQYNRYNSGTLDQVRIYNTTLSASNVALLYAETSATSSTLNYPAGTGGIALYEFSGNANSTSSSANNGTATDVLYAFNGTATDVTYGNGRFNEAANFNGSSSLISVPNSAGNNISTFSVSLWFKTSGHSGTGTLINNGGADSTQNGWYLGLNASGNLIFTTSQGGVNGPYTTGTTNYEDSSWHNVVLVYNAIGAGTSTYNVYVDGNSTPEVTGTNGQFSTTATQPLIIGRFARVAIEPFNGSIDQVRIFSSALAPGDIQDLYNEHFPTKFTDGSDTALKFTGGTGDITFADTAPVFTPGDNFNAVLYTGNNSTQSISTVGFEPGMIWFKNRNGTNSHAIVDVVRGRSSYIYPDLTAVANSSGATNDVTSFDSLGFSLGSVSQAGSTNTTTGGSNNLVAWSWKAGGAARNNTDGSIASLVSANTAAGFSIMSYAGNSQSSATIGHGLSSAPELIITKARNFAAGWPTMVKTSSTSAYGLRLNSTGANDPANGLGFYNNTAPTSTVYSVGGSDEVNDNYNYIAYAWHSVAGYSKIGSYTGTSVANHSIVTGFKPAWVMIKNNNSGYSWIITDDKRTTDKILYTNLSQGEDTTSNGITSFDSNGFTLGTAVSFNQNTDVYIYMAFATNPT